MKVPIRQRCIAQAPECRREAEAGSARSPQGEVRRVFGAPSRTGVIRWFRVWRTKWLDEAEAAVRYLEKDLFHCLHYFRFPKELWTTIRTTNILEWAFWARPTSDAPDGRVHQRRVGQTDHVRCDTSFKCQLGGASRSTNSAERLTLRARIFFPSKCHSAASGQVGQYIPSIPELGMHPKYFGFAKTNWPRIVYIGHADRLLG